MKRIRQRNKIKEGKENDEEIWKIKIKRTRKKNEMKRKGKIEKDEDIEK